MRLILFYFFLAFSISLTAQEITWKQHPVDGHRTGVTQGTADKTTESMGEVKKFRKYKAPNGESHKKRTATRRVAKVLLDAQDVMAPVKEVIGHSKKSMTKQRPECELTNWFIDILMAKTEEITGKHVDIGFSNFGGVRTDMPEGDILKDDIMSMFPFKSNTLYYFTIKGESILEILNNMAYRSGEIIGGMKVIFKDRKLESATIGGEPIDPEKIYGAATINFLMEGKGWFRFGKYEIEGIDTEIPILDMMLEYVENQTKQGKEIEYHRDGRITIL